MAPSTLEHRGVIPPSPGPGSNVNRMADHPSRPNLKYPDRQSLPGSARRNVPLLVETILPLLREWEGEDEDEDEDEGEASREKERPSSSLGGFRRSRRALEIAAGYGDLTLALSKAVRERAGPISTEWQWQWQWLCTEGDEALLPLIRENLLKNGTQGEPEEIRIARLDVDDTSDWIEIFSSSSSSSSLAPFDLILISNLLHIVPLSTVQHLFHHLPPLLNPRNSHASVCVYGAFNEGGGFTSEGNRNFDTDLRSRNASYGLRDLQGEIVPLAQRNGLRLERVVRLERGNLPAEQSQFDSILKNPD